MEPCLFRHGKPRRGRGLTLVRPRASMEPCLFRHGKTTLELETPFFSKASMEPCLFRHGKAAFARPPPPVPVMLQWSHVFSDMVRTLERQGSLFDLSRFNGAMSFQTW